MKTAIYQSRVRIEFGPGYIFLDTGGLKPAEAKELLNAESAKYGLGFAAIEDGGSLLIMATDCHRQSYRLNARNRVRMERRG
jgi:hypothetical protein